MRTGLIIGVAAAVAAAPVSAQVQPSIDGTWDLIWQTRRGPDRAGYLVIRSRQGRIAAEIHGKGAVKASGTATANTFELHGTRMLVPYTITGSWSGNSMRGAFKVLHVEKRFVGERRPSN